MHDDEWHESGRIETVAHFAGEIILYRVLDMLTLLLGCSENCGLGSSGPPARIIFRKRIVVDHGRRYASRILFEMIHDGFSGGGHLQMPPCWRVLPTIRASTEW